MLYWCFPIGNREVLGHLDDSDLLEALPVEFLGNDLAGGATLVKQQNLGPLVHLFQGCNLQSSYLQHVHHLSGCWGHTAHAGNGDTLDNNNPASPAVEHVTSDAPGATMFLNI